MNYLVKIEDKIQVLNVISSIPNIPGMEVIGIVPEGLDVSKPELLELVDGEVVHSLSKHIEAKMVEVRTLRDEKLVENDKAWLIAAKRKEDTSALEIEAQELRDLPEVAQLALSEMESIEEVKNYNPFEV